MDLRTTGWEPLFQERRKPATVTANNVSCGPRSTTTPARGTVLILIQGRACRHEIDDVTSKSGRFGNGRGNRSRFEGTTVNLSLYRQTQNCWNHRRPCGHYYCNRGKRFLVESGKLILQRSLTTIVVNGYVQWGQFNFFFWFRSFFTLRSVTTFYYDFYVQVEIAPNRRELHVECGVRVGDNERSHTARIPQIRCEYRRFTWCGRQRAENQCSSQTKTRGSIVSTLHTQYYCTQNVCSHRTSNGARRNINQRRRNIIK